MKVTIKDIAEKAGVSITTVSQILNNKGSRFSEETRRKVLQVIEEYDYKPDFFASNLINRHSKTIGMIVPDITDFFFSKVIEGVESYLNPLGYMIILCNSRNDKEREIRYLEELAHRSVDGILLATPNVLGPKYGPHSDFYRRMPLILLDRGVNERETGRLLVKEYEGAYQAVKLLVDYGHRHIGMLRETEDYYQLSERYNAYRHVLTDAGISYRKEYVCEGELTTPGGYHAAKKLLENPEITAIFCSNDSMAVGCYQAIYEAGKKVPEDISVIGFDGLKITQYMVPPLTTVSQSSFDMGFYAAKFLVDAIDFPNRRIPNKIFDAKLIIRESVRALTES